MHKWLPKENINIKVAKISNITYFLYDKILKPGISLHIFSCQLVYLVAGLLYSYLVAKMLYLDMTLA
jgi:predicted Na+-dependent transporter